MGQIVGTPVCNNRLQKFRNYPKAAIQSFWASYKLLGEAWGLPVEDVQAIFKGSQYIVDHIGIKDEDVQELFVALDTDTNGLIDALEMVVGITLLSGLDMSPKVSMVLSFYDFSARGSISRDELSLLLRTVVKVYAKIYPSTLNSIDETDIESLAQTVFSESGLLPSQRIAIADFTRYAVRHPVMYSWLVSFTANPHPGSSISSSRNGQNILDDANPLSRSINLSEETLDLPIESKTGSSEAVLSEVVTTPWYEEVDKTLSEEGRAANPARVEVSEDSMDPLWIFGFNTDSAPNFRGSNAAYIGATVLSTIGGSEDAPANPATAVETHNGTLVYPSSQFLVTLQRIATEEAKTVRQGLGWEHSSGITSLEVSDCRRFVVTTENPNPQSQNSPRVVLWEVTTDSQQQQVVVVRSTRVFPSSPRIRIHRAVLSADSKTLLVLSSSPRDGVSAVFSLFDVSSATSMKPLGVVDGGFTVDEISDVTFGESSSIIAVGTTTRGLHFLVEEVQGVYQRRDALYPNPALGPPATAEESAVSTLTRMRIRNDLCIVAGSKTGGYVSVFNFRVCQQKIRVFQDESVAVSRLGANVSQKGPQSLVVGGSTGTVAILKVASNPNPNPAKGKNPAADLNPGRLEVVVEVPVPGSLPGEGILSVDIRPDGDRLLMSTTGGRLLEMSLSGPLPVPPGTEVAAPVPAEGEEAAGGEAPAAEQPSVKVGDEVSGGMLDGIRLGPVPCQTTDLCRVQGGFATCGSDGSIRVFSVLTEGSPSPKLLKSIGANGSSNGTQVRCVRMAANSSSSLIAVAVTSDTPDSGSGVMVYSLPDLTLVAEFPGKVSGRYTVSDLKFHPADGTLVASDAEKGFVVYQPGAEAGTPWTVKSEFQAPFSVFRFDMSTDGAVMRVQGSQKDQYTILELTSAAPGTAVTNPETLKAIPGWASFHVNYQTDAKNLYHHIRPDAKITSIDRFTSMVVSTDPNDQGSIVLTKAPYYKAPTGPLPPRVAIRAHLGPVAAVTFVEEGTKVVTASESSVIVWKVTVDPEEGEAEELPPAPTEGGEDGEGAPAEGEGEGGEEDESIPVAIRELYRLRDSDDEDQSPVDGWALEGDNADGDALLKGCGRVTHRRSGRVNSNQGETPAGPLDLAAFRNNNDVLSSTIRSVVNGPANGQESWDAEGVIPDDFPDSDLEVAWVHGYSGRHVRQSVRYNSRGQLIYPAGRHLIVLDKVQQRQKVLATHHWDVVTAFDVDMVRDVVVSGYSGPGLLRLAVWNAVDGDLIRYLTLPHDPSDPLYAISAVAISPCGSYVLAATQNSMHSIFVVDLASGIVKSRIDHGDKKVLAMCFSPYCEGFDGPAVPVSGPRFLAVGTRSFSFYEAKSSLQSWSRRRGLFGDVKKCDVLCCAPVPRSLEGGNEFVVGLANGSIALLPRGDRKLSTVFPAQPKGKITGVQIIRVKEATADELTPVFRIVTSGSFGFVKVLDTEGQPVKEFNIFTQTAPGQDVPSFAQIDRRGTARGFRGLSVDRFQRKAALGTAAGEIVEMDLDTGLDVNAGSDVFSPLVHSHFKGGLRGLAAHPIRPEVLTAGDDKVARIWGLDSNRMINKIDLPAQATSAAFSPNGHIVAVGLAAGAATEPVALPRCAIISYLQSQLRLIHTVSDPLDEVLGVGFSADGSLLFAGSRDGRIYVYNALDNFKLVTTMGSAAVASQVVDGTEGSESVPPVTPLPVRRLDVSSDGTVLVSYASSDCSTIHEVRFWDAVTHEALSDEAREDFMRTSSSHRGGARPLFSSTGGTALNHPDSLFYSRSGFTLPRNVGIFPGTAVSSTSPFADLNCLAESETSKFYCVGDLMGDLRLLTCPSQNRGAPCRRYRAHCPQGGVSSVTFANHDQYLVSTGSADRTVVVWRLCPVSSATDRRPVVSQFASFSAKGVAEAKDGPTGDFDASFQVKSVSFIKNTDCEQKTDVQANLVAVANLGGTLALRESVSKAYRKEDFNSENATSGPSGPLRPFSSLALNSSFAKYLGTHDLVTGSGRLVSVLRRTDGQSEFKSVLHRGVSGTQSATLTPPEIGSVAVSSCKGFLAVGVRESLFEDDRVASGNKSTPSVVVVRAVSLEVVASLSLDEAFRSSSQSSPSNFNVVSIDFSEDGKHLCVLLNDSVHSGFVFRSNSGQWDDSSLLCQFSLTLSEVSLVSFFSAPPQAAYSPASARDEAPHMPIGPGPVRLCVAGVGGVFFLEIQGRNVVTKEVSRSHPESGESERVLGVTALAAVPRTNFMITGHDNGHMLCWSWDQVQAGRPIFVGSHGGPVSKITPYSTVPTLTSSESQASSGSPAKGHRLLPKLKFVPETSGGSYGVVSGSYDCLKVWDLATFSCTKEVSLAQIRQKQGHFSANFNLGNTPKGLVDFSSFQQRDNLTDVFVSDISVDVHFRKVLVTVSSQQVIEVALDTFANTQLLMGEVRRVVQSDQHPKFPELMFTATQDKQVNVWNIASSHQRIVGQITVDRPVTGLTVLTPNVLLIGFGDSNTAGTIFVIHLSFYDDNNACVDSTSLSESTLRQSNISLVRLDIVDRINNIGRGALYGFKSSPDNSLLLASCADGFVHLLSTRQTEVFEWKSVPASSQLQVLPQVFEPLGSMKTYAENVAVGSADFSDCGRYVRAFGKVVFGDRSGSADYFDISEVSSSSGGVVSTNAKTIGKKVEEAFELEVIRDTITFASAQSVLCPELRGLYHESLFRTRYSHLDGASRGDFEGLCQVVSSNNRKLAAASTLDGTVRVYRMPSFNKNDCPILELRTHVKGAVRLHLQNLDVDNEFLLTTIGDEDGTFQIWKVSITVNEEIKTEVVQDSQQSAATTTAAAAAE